jgi:hypothetical protein
MPFYDSFGASAFKFRGISPLVFLLTQHSPGGYYRAQVST